MSKSKKELITIDSLRDNLIDLSIKNKFLNFNWYEYSLPIIDVDFFDIFSRLVLEKNEFELTYEKSIEELNDLLNDESFTDRIKIDAVKKSIRRIENFNENKNLGEYFSQNTLSLFKIPEFYINRTNEFILDTPLNENELNSLLDQMDLKIKKDLFLDGIPILFLALGFLEYNDLIAPLIFIPVVLEKRAEKYYIKFNSHSEIKLNHDLKLKLAENDINLPLTDIKTERDMIDYLNNVNYILPNDYHLKPFVALSLFDFKKNNLYEDLNIENLSEPSIEELNYFLCNNEESMNDQSQINAKDLDSLNRRNKYNVSTVDSCQESIIEEAKLGKNIFVDTHSATNKTETILNLITNIIANKKTVLYVSDKIAAINKIKDELDEIGLKIAYLDLYGTNYDNNHLINEIIRSADYNFEDLNFEKKYFNLKIISTYNLNNKICRYLDFIHSPFKKTNICPYDLLGLRESNLFEIEKSGKEVKTLKMDSISNLNEKQLEEIFDSIANISSIYIEKIAPASEHIFKDYNVDIPDDEFMSILNILPILNKLIDNLIDLNRSVYEDYGVKELEKLEDLEWHFNNLEILEKNPNIMGKDKKKLLEYVSSLENLQTKLNEYGPIDELEKSLINELKESKKDLIFYITELNELKKQINDYNLTLNNFKQNLNVLGVKKLNSLDEINDSFDKLELLTKSPSIVENDKALKKFIQDIEFYQRENEKNPLKDLIKSINSNSAKLLNESLNKINDYLPLEPNIAEVNELIIKFNDLKDDIGFIKLNSLNEISDNISICNLLMEKPVLVKEDDNLDQFYIDFKKGYDKFPKSSYDEYYNSFNKEFADMQTNIIKEVSKSSVLESKLSTIYNELKNLKKCLDDFSEKTFTKKVSSLKEIEEYLDNFDLFLMDLKPIEEKDKEEVYAYIQLIKEKQDNYSYFDFSLSEIEKTIDNIIFIQKTLDELNYNDTILKENLTQDLENFRMEYSKLRISPIEIKSYTRRNELKKELNEFKELRGNIFNSIRIWRIKNDLKDYYKTNPPRNDDNLIRDYEDYFITEGNVKKYLLNIRKHDKIPSKNFYDDYERIYNSVHKLINLKKRYLEVKSLIANYSLDKNFFNGALEELILIKSKLEKANDIKNMDEKLGKYFPNSYKRFDTNLNELFDEYEYSNQYEQLYENGFFEKAVNSLSIGKEDLKEEKIQIKRIKDKIYYNVSLINNINLKNSYLNFDTIFSLDLDDLIDYCGNLYNQIRTSNEYFNENIKLKNIDDIEIVFENLDYISSFDEIRVISDVSNFNLPLTKLKDDFELLKEFNSMGDIHAEIIQRYYADIWNGMQTPLEDIEKRNKNCKEFTQLYNENYFSENIFKSFDNSIKDKLNTLELLSNELKTKILSFDKELVLYKGDLLKISLNNLKNQNSTIFVTINSLKEYKNKLSSYDSDNLIRFKKKATIYSIDKINDFEENSDKYLSIDSIKIIENLLNDLEELFNDSNIINNSVLSYKDKLSINNINSKCKLYHENIIIRNAINSQNDLINNHFYHENNEFNLWFGPLSNVETLKDKVKEDRKFTKLFNDNFFSDKTLELIDKDHNNLQKCLEKNREYYEKLDSILRHISQFDILKEEDFINKSFNSISRKLKTIETELINIEEDFNNLDLYPENEDNQNPFDVDICTMNIVIIEKISDYKFIKSIQDKSNILENHKKILNTNLNNVKELYSLKNNFDSKNIDEKYFKNIYNSYDTDVLKLKEQIDINLEYEKLFNKGFFNSNIDKIFLDSKEYDTFYEKIEDLEELINEITFNLDIIDLLYNKEKTYLKYEILELSDLINFLEINQSSLVDWRNFEIYCDSDDDISREFIRALHNDEIDKEFVFETFAYNFANNFLKEIESDDFNLTAKDIEDYKNLNNEINDLNKLRVLNNIKENRPDFNKNDSDYKAYKAYSYLNNEFNARYKKSIKDFLINAMDYVKFIKPIFLMNPNAVSEYLDHDNFDSYFDYVIYDDISGVNIEDSISSLLRAKNKIIFSNTKIKSNLGLSNLLKSKFINKSLKWTNLDMDESLLEFSNKHYYNNDLIFYKTPEKNFDSSLKFKHIKEGQFDKESKTNVIEAEKIVEYAFNHFKSYTNTMSLGIIAFTSEQKELIYDLIIKRLDETPELSEYFNSYENFFINDINEAYQTRDIILTSLTYGFDKENELNIDIPFENEYLINLVLTRALKRNILFSNFKSKDIIINKDSSYAEKTIKDLFEFIDDKRLYENDKFFNELNRDYINLEYNKPELNIFENYICDFLINEGFIVKRQYGICNNYIDIVVADKENINKNLLAIICDKTNYESFNTINDREILNVNLLENLGWNHYHIYASEWYNNPKESKKNLLDAINKAIENKDLSDFGVIIEEEDIFDVDFTEKITDMEAPSEEGTNFSDIYSDIDLGDDFVLSDDVDIDLGDDFVLSDDVDIDLGILKIIQKR